MTTETLPISMFAKGKCEIAGLSDRYQFISTEEVVAIAQSFGWEIKKAGEATRVKFKGYQKHIVIMEKSGMEVGIDGRIQLVIRNSHDGRSGLQLFLGYMRIICDNQIFAKNLGDGVSITIRHSRKGLETLNTFLSAFDQNTNIFREKVVSMQNRIIAIEKQKEFARSVLSLRFSEEALTDEVITTALAPVREGDAEDTIWNITNRLQERLVHGQLSIYNTKTKKLKKVRKLTGTDTLVNLNSKIMELATAW